MSAKALFKPFGAWIGAGFVLMAFLCLNAAPLSAQDKLQPTETSLFQPAKPIPGAAPVIALDDPSGTATTDPFKNPIFLALDTEMQGRILDEATTYGEECQRNPSYSRFHDCTCQSLKYFETRLNFPDLPEIGIKDKIQSSCVDTASIAGYGFEHCKIMYKYERVRDLDTMCECYANNLARAYERNPRPYYDTYIQQGAVAFTTCKRQQY